MKNPTGETEQINSSKINKDKPAIKLVNPYEPIQPAKSRNSTSFNIPQSKSSTALPAKLLDPYENVHLLPRVSNKGQDASIHLQHLINKDRVVNKDQDVLA